MRAVLVFLFVVLRLLLHAFLHGFLFVQAPTAITLRGRGEGRKDMKIELSVAGPETSYLRGKFLILCEACPLDPTNTRACPFHDIRKGALRERMAWFDGLSEEAILSIQTYCRLCMEAKKS